MKKFKFSMQSILNVNRAQREVRQMELAAEQAALDKELLKLSRIQGQIRRAMDPDQHVSELTGAYLLQREKYIKSLRDKRRQQQFQVQQTKAKVDSAIQRLTEANVEVKRMEKAETNEREKWTLEFNREQQRLSDEIGTGQAHRQRVASV